MTAESVYRRLINDSEQRRDPDAILRKEKALGLSSPVKIISVKFLISFPCIIRIIQKQACSFF